MPRSLHAHVPHGCSIDYYSVWGVSYMWWGYGRIGHRRDIGWITNNFELLTQKGSSNPLFICKNKALTFAIPPLFIIEWYLWANKISTVRAATREWKDEWKRLKPSVIEWKPNLRSFEWECIAMKWKCMEVLNNNNRWWLWVRWRAVGGGQQMAGSRVCLYTDLTNWSGHIIYDIWRRNSSMVRICQNQNIDRSNKHTGPPNSAAICSHSFMPMNTHHHLPWALAWPYRWPAI